MNERIIDVVCSDNSARNCAIRLDGISCDGYKEGMLIGAFSHFHDDHIRSIPSCIASYNVLIIHPITFEGINALHPGMRYREQWVTQDYDTEYRFDAGTLRLLKANHIPGSSQVYIESDGETMLYSGDFGYPDVQIRQADHLVIDSSHGDPWYDGNTDRHSVKNRMFEYAEEHLESRPQMVIQGHSGTLQEIVRHFEVGYGKKMDSGIAFVMEKRQKKVLHSIYRAERHEFRDIIEYESPEYWKMINDNKKCIVFSTASILDEQLRSLHKIIIDQFRFTKSDAPIIPFEGGCRFNLAAHTSINGIYKYIEAVNPKYIVTDYSRSRYAKRLAKLIEQKFPDIKTEYRPPYDVHA